jgi:hypothetical protein
MAGGIGARINLKPRSHKETHRTLPRFHLFGFRISLVFAGSIQLASRTLIAARVAELADALDLGSSPARGGSSSLPSRNGKRGFSLGMHGCGQISSHEVVAAFDLSRFQCLIDLGGATGHLAIAACQRYPKMRAIVFDLPRVIPLAREKINESSDSLSRRIGTHSFPADHAWP